jgi:cysteine desulfurase
MMDLVYMDHAATTPLDERVFDAMRPFFFESYGNPSSIYTLARTPKTAIKKAREKVATVLGCRSHEVYFTSGGTESDNWAIRGIARGNSSKGRHIISSRVEHHAVLHTLERLEKEGFEVTLLDVDRDGMVSRDDLREALRPDTVLVTIMAANNETGTLMPVSEIGRLCRENGTYFHTDAVQAAGSLPLDVVEMRIDALSLSAHKFYGPKGVGALYVRGGIIIENLMDGGAQERGRRPGTENVAGIVGLSRALELAAEEMEATSGRVTVLRDRMIDGLLAIPLSKLNGPRGDRRLPNNVNVSFDGIEGEELLLSLDLEGVMASSGSACTSGALDPSHVLMAIGNDRELSRGSLRLSLGRSTTEDDVDRVISLVTEIVMKQRALRNKKTKDE